MHQHAKAAEVLPIRRGWVATPGPVSTIVFSKWPDLGTFAVDAKAIVRGRSPIRQGRKRFAARPWIRVFPAPFASGRARERHAV